MLYWWLHWLLGAACNKAWGLICKALSLSGCNLQVLPCCNIVWTIKALIIMCILDERCVGEMYIACDQLTQYGALIHCPLHPHVRVTPMDLLQLVVLALYTTASCYIQLLAMRCRRYEICIVNFALTWSRSNKAYSCNIASQSATDACIVPYMSTIRCTVVT